MSEDTTFVDGLIVKAPHPNAPDFVKASISIKRADLGNWLRGRSEEWINVDVKESKGGKWYAAINDFVPDASKSQPSRAAPDNSGRQQNSNPPADNYDDDIPF
jgi:single-stranded DNA-binding protein